MLICAVGAPNTSAAPVLTTIGPPAATKDTPLSVAFHPDAPLLATANQHDDSVSMFWVSPGGVLTSVGLPTKTGAEPFAAEFSADGNFLATADAGAEGGDSVSLFSVTRATGELKFLTRLPSQGPSPQALAFSPTGRLIATADRNGAGFVSMYSVTADGVMTAAHRKPVADINAVAFSSKGLLATSSYNSDLVHVFRVSPTGALTAAGPPVLADRDPRSVAFSPDGSLLATANLSGDSVSMFRVSETGTLTTIQLKTPAGNFPVSVAFSGDGKLLATANRDSHSVSVFKVSAEGDLTRVPTPTATSATGPKPTSVAFSPAGQGRPLIAAANSAGNSVSMFAVSPRGVLTPIGSPAATGPAPAGVAFNDPAGTLLATANRLGPSVSVFSVSSGGMLQSAGNKPSGKLPLSLAWSDNGLLATANHGDGTVSVSPVTPTGGVGTASVQPTSAPAYSVAFRKGGSWVATANPTNDSVSLFAVSPTGTLTPKTLAVPTGRFPVWVAFSPDGTRLATANQRDHKVRVFSFTDDGVLTSLGEATTDLGPTSVAFSPNGRLLATANDGGDSVSLLRLDGGTLTTRQLRVPAGLGPVAVAFSPDGTLVATANRSNNTASLYRVTPQEMLEPVGGASPTGQAPTALAFSPLGRQLAVANFGENTVSMLSLAAPDLDTEITSSPPPATRSPTVTFEFEANYPSTFECRIDAEPFEPCPTPKPTPNLAEGNHTFDVRGVDLVGAIEDTPDRRSWLVDLTPPAPVTLSKPEISPEQPASPAFSWLPTTDNLTGIKHYELLIDGIKRATVSPPSCSATCSASPDGVLVHGDHVWKVVAVDGVGNESSSVQRALKVDTQPPAAAVLQSPVANVATATRRPALSWAAAVDAGIGLAGYDVLLDDVPVAELGAAATTFTPASDLADGPHTWQVVARDAYGHAASSATGRFIVDTAPPLALVNGAPNPSLVMRAVTFDATPSSDRGSGIARYEWDLDGDGTFERDSGATTSTMQTFTEAAFYVVQLRVTDRAGNTATGRVDQKVSAIVDPERDPLGITINGGDKFTKSTKVTLDATWPSFATQMLVSNDGGFKTAQRMALQKQVDWKLDAAGAERDTMTVYVRYVRGLTESPYQDDIILDARAPVVSAATLVTKGKRTPVLALKARDRGPSRLGALQFTNSRKNPKAKFRAYEETVKLASGKGERPLKLRKTIYVRVRDNAGNLSDWRKVRRSRSTR